MADHHTPHIIVVPTPGIGHLIPLTEFAKRLVFHHDFSITFYIPIDEAPPSNAQTTLLNSLPKSIHYMYLPPVNVDDLPENVTIEARLCVTLTRSISSLRDVMMNMVRDVGVAALVVDLFGTAAFDVAEEFYVPRYVFFPSTAMGLSLSFELSKLNETVSCEFKHLPEPVKLPGCVPVHGIDLPDPFQDRSNDAYKWLLHQTQRYKTAEGILVNSFIDLEPGAFEALKEKKPRVYPVGPLIQTGGTNGGDGFECFKWLDGQPHGSVLFISFGSGGTLSNEQINELAFGLQMSRQRFLWVVRSPSMAASASYFSAHSTKNPFDFLPKGFLESTRDLGLVVPSWAPQIQILSHVSTAGFLSHCGWNSALESIVHGVPLIAWPLYAEQKMNAVMLDAMKVALRLKSDENGLVHRREIAKVVKALMEGEEGVEVRNKMKELKGAASRVLSEDGSSTKSLCEVADKWKTHNQ